MTAPFARKSFPTRLGGQNDARPLQLRAVTLHWLDVKRDYHYSLHRHDFYELIVPLKGAYRCALNGEPFSVRPGRLLFVQEGDLHEDFYQPGTRFASFLFSLHDFSGSPWEHGVFAREAPLSARIIPLRRGGLGGLCSLILREGKTRRHPSLSVEALVEAFFWLLAEQLDEPLLAPPFLHGLHETAFRRRLFDAFASKLRERPAMSAIARELGMSERSLDTQCRATLGTSPARAFAAYKVREAARLIAAGARVQDAAFALGFADAFHFSKVFKRHLGCPPSEYAGKAAS